MAIRSIIFDLWETLGTKNIRLSKILGEHFGIANIPDFSKRYEQSIQLNKWANQKDMARSFLSAFNCPLNDENIHFVAETLQKGINNATLFEGMRELLARLKKNYTLAILSNTTVFEANIITKWNLKSYFETQVYSWQTGKLKPSKRNFNEICAQLTVKPEECIFIDDGLENIEAARKYGFKVIPFQDLQQLKKELVSFSIKMD